uniref:Uncharacterized protein n=1 Tax=Oryza brachyantha TaxID=4533 RepID=J3LSX9_ORYBR
MVAAATAEAACVRFWSRRCATMRVFTCRSSFASCTAASISPPLPLVRWISGCAARWWSRSSAELLTSYYCLFAVWTSDWNGEGVAAFFQHGTPELRE